MNTPPSRPVPLSSAAFPSGASQPAPLLPERVAEPLQGQPYRSLVTRIERVVWLGLLCVTTVVLGVAVLLDITARRAESLGASQAWAHALAVQVESAVVFDDHGTAAEMLRASANYPHVLGVVVSSQRADRLLAAHPVVDLGDSLTSTLMRWPDDAGLWATSARLSAPVMSRGERVGTVFALVDMRHMWRSVVQQALALLATLLLAALLVGALMRPMLRRVLAPVSHLTEMVQNLSRHADFSARMSVHANDEVGLLTMRVNHMLAQIEERDARLAASHRRLQALKQQADQASQAKGDFLAHMSHEIRTPLSTINISTYLALKSGLDFRQRGHVDRIRQAAEHLQSIVNDVLDFSKIEAGKVVIESVPFTWADLLRQLDNIVGQQARDKGLQCDFHTDAQLPSQLLGDPVRIAQVLVNLVHNAVKFTAHGGVTVSTQVLPAGADTTCLRVAVTDTGAGIPADQMGQLFQAFHQLDHGTARTVGGTGLGLVICKQLVALMGGDMGVSSEQGRGSCFWFTLQLGVPPQAAAPAGQAWQAVAPALGGVQLLLVDDSQAYQQVAAELLRQAGAHVALASSGADALACMAQTRFDVVLMDVQMPGMDGLEATRRIRAQPQWAQVPVIAMTANARPEERQLCLQAGMTDFLAKPFDPPTLIRLIADTCQPAVSIPTPTPIATGTDTPSTVAVGGTVHT